MNSISAYINGALEELRHVRWPTRQQAVRFSAVVIAFVAVSAVFFGVVDFGLSAFIATLAMMEVVNDLDVRLPAGIMTVSDETGGYVGDGVGSSNLAGRTLADLISGRDSELVRLPWVGHRSPVWEPEPLRWLGINAGLKAMELADVEVLLVHLAPLSTEAIAAAEH